jgi:hypothetical protein
VKQDADGRPLPPDSAVVPAQVEVRYCCGDLAEDQPDDTSLPTPSRQLGFPLAIASFLETRSKTSEVFSTSISSWVKSGTPGPDITIVDSPGFGDVRSADQFKLTDPGICLEVCHEIARPELGGATALLFFVSSHDKCDEVLKRQLLMLQHFFGDNVWNRIVFMFRESSDGAATMPVEHYRSKYRSIVYDGLEAVRAETGRDFALRRLHQFYPCIVGKSDSPADLLGKIRWAMRQSGIDVSGPRLTFTYAPTSCTRCSCSNDVRMLSALQKFGVTVGGSFGMCHPGFKEVPVMATRREQRAAIAHVGVRVVGRSLMFSFGMPFIPFSGLVGGALELHRLANSPDTRPVFDAAMRGIKSYRTVCAVESCGRDRTTPGCCACGGAVQHVFMN